MSNAIDTLNAIAGIATEKPAEQVQTSADLIPEVTKFAGDVNVLVKAIHQRIVDTKVALQDSINEMKAEVARREELLSMLNNQLINLKDDLVALKDIEMHAHEALLRQIT